MPVVGNRIKVASSSTGTGNITLGSAEDGYQTFASGGISNNDVVRYVITEGSAWEIGKGTYLTSGPTLVRTSGNLLESSTGSLLNLGGSATVFVSLADVDVMQTDGGTFSGDVTVDGAAITADNYYVDQAGRIYFLDTSSAQKARIGLHSGLRLYAGSTGTNSNAYMRFNGEGSTPIIEPSAAAGATVGTNETIDFGGSSNRWKDIYGKNLDVSTNITVGGTVDGRDVATDGTKLDGIEAGANVGPSLAVAIALG